MLGLQRCLLHPAAVCFIVGLLVGATACSASAEPADRSGESADRPATGATRTTSAITPELSAPEISGTTLSTTADDFSWIQPPQVSVNEAEPGAVSIRVNMLCPNWDTWITAPEPWVFEQSSAIPTDVEPDSVITAGQWQHPDGATVTLQSPGIVVDADAATEWESTEVFDLDPPRRNVVTIGDDGGEYVFGQQPLSPWPQEQRLTFGYCPLSYHGTGLTVDELVGFVEGLAFEYDG